MTDGAHQLVIALSLLFGKLIFISPYFYKIATLHFVPLAMTGVEHYVIALSLLFGVAKRSVSYVAIPTRPVIANVA